MLLSKISNWLLKTGTNYVYRQNCLCKRKKFYSSLITCSDCTFLLICFVLLVLTTFHTLWSLFGEKKIFHIFRKTTLNLLMLNVLLHSKENHFSDTSKQKSLSNFTWNQYFSLFLATLKLFFSCCFMLMFPPCCKSSSHTPECDGSHPCIHHYKWRLRGLKSDHAWVKVYHSPVTAIYLHTAPTLSLINEQGNVELLSVGGGGLTGIHRDWRSVLEWNHW